MDLISKTDFMLIAEKHITAKRSHIVVLKGENISHKECTLENLPILLMDEKITYACILYGEWCGSYLFTDSMTEKEIDEKIKQTHSDSTFWECHHFNDRDKLIRQLQS